MFTIKRRFTSASLSFVIAALISIAITIVIGSNAQADIVNYSLDDVILADNTQMTGTFSWTYEAGDFENGVGEFTSLTIPHTTHDQTDLKTTIETGQIEITLVGNFHDDGVDITLRLLQPFTATTASEIDSTTSQHEIGGNGFHSGNFQGGFVTPTSVPEPAMFVFLGGLAIVGLLSRNRCSC